MSKEKLLNQVGLNGQKFPFVAHLNVYPLKVLDSPLEYQHWCDFLCYILQHEIPRNLAFFDSLEPTSENCLKAVSAILDDATKLMFKENELAYIEKEKD